LNNTTLNNISVIIWRSVLLKNKKQITVEKDAKWTFNIDRKVLIEDSTS
jgi:hypothetical protein